MHKSIIKYLHKSDLRSINELVHKHVDFLQKRQQCKYARTTDSQTIQIAQKILSNNKFLKDNILGIPSMDTKQTQSMLVQICNIKKYPKIQNIYKNWKQDINDINNGRIVAVGGPAATDQTLLSCMIPQIKNKNTINFYCKNYLQSNILHSAGQSHARHGSALNADPVLSGRHLLPLVVKRMIRNPTIQQILKSDYIKVDVNLSNFSYLKQYFKNQVNGLVQILKQKLNIINEHDLNRLQSVASQEIQKLIENNLQIKIRSNNKLVDENSMAIHAIFTQKSLKQVKNQHEHMKNVKQIQWSQLNNHQINQYFPHSTGILAAFRYHHDYSNPYDLYNTIRDKCTDLGTVWQQNKRVNKVYVSMDENNSKPIACGIGFNDDTFVPANKIHLSLGYKAKYIYQGYQQSSPLNSIVIPATGVSMTILLKKTVEIQKILSQKHNAFEIAIINSHWTVIYTNQQYVLMRATAGGNTGSQSYKPAYFINLFKNTKNLFGQAFIGIVSVYGCSRAVNYKNSTQFAQIADGLIVSYGKGGTGNTKRSSQAYKALKYLGFQKQLNEYFNNSANKNIHQRLDIVKTMANICKQSEKVNFFYSNKNKTRTFLTK